MTKSSIPGVNRFRIDKLRKHNVDSCVLCRERKITCSKVCSLCSCFLDNSLDSVPSSQLLNRDSIKDKQIPVDSDEKRDGKTPLNRLTSTLVDKAETQGNESKIIFIKDKKKENKTKDNVKHECLSEIESTDERSIKCNTNLKQSKIHFSETHERNAVNTNEATAAFFQDLEEQTDRFKAMNPNLTNTNSSILLKRAPADQNMDASQSLDDDGLKMAALPHPSLRIGPVFTTLFNSSINQKEKPARLDLNLLKSFFPRKAECDLLMNRYRSSVHPILPILDFQTIYPLYEGFWNDSHTVGISFYILIFTIFYASSVSLYEERSIRPDSATNPDELSQRMSFFVGATEIALAMSEYPRKITLVGLQSSAILYTIVRNDCRTDDSVSIASLVRCAQLIELNRDPSTYHHLNNHKEVQYRRLLWWQIFYLDCTTALSTKLPPLIHSDQYDTQLPAEYQDSRSSGFLMDQAIVFANGRYKWVQCTNNILQQSFCTNLVSEQTRSRIAREIEDLSLFCCSSIQRMLDPMNIMPSQEVFVKFATSVLATLADRCCILSTILFSEKIEEDNNFPKLQNNLSLAQNNQNITSSISNIRHYNLNEELCEKQIHLLTEFVHYGEMPRNSIFVWEIRKFQPIQALLFLLRCLILDVYYTHCTSGVYYSDFSGFKNQPKIKIIERSIQELDYLSQHTTPLCRERWKIVKDLKRITWQTLFKKESLIDNYSTCLHASGSDKSSVCGRNWDELSEEMSNIERIIGENINLKMWDDDAGHFL